MSEEISARLGLPYLAAGQLQKHVTLNEALTCLDALVQTAAASRTLAVEPEAEDGALYILPEGAAGETWSKFPAGSLVRAEAGGWTVQPSPQGHLAVVLDSGEVVRRSGGGWVALGQALSRLGVNTIADAANPVALRTPKVLMTAPGGGDDDLRLTLNKSGTSDVLSLLLQSGWSGRAEIGLIGDDDLTFKVAGDDGVWREALKIERATGRVNAAQGVGRVETHVFTEDDTLTIPAWARTVAAILVGGGGGGGAGAFGPAGSGGGGGGGGGFTRGLWPADVFNGVTTVEIGRGGRGGEAVTSGDGGAGLPGGDTRLLNESGVCLSAFGGRGGAGGAGVTSSGGLAGRGGNPGGSASPAAVGAAGEADVDPFGAGGGGGGGGVSDGVGLSGGLGGAGGSAARACGGGEPGGPGVSASDAALSPSGGGGGGGSGGSPGQAGGDGGAFGGGGGGGGAGLSRSGGGGRGADGAVVLLVMG